MSTALEVRDAAAALVSAEAAEAFAQGELDSKLQEALLMVPNEQAALDAAQSAFNTALANARDSLNVGGLVEALNAAIADREIASQQLTAVIAEYDGT